MSTLRQSSNMSSRWLSKSTMCRYARVSTSERTTSAASSSTTTLLTNNRCHLVQMAILQGRRIIICGKFQVWHQHITYYCFIVYSNENGENFPTHSYTHICYIVLHLLQLLPGQPGWAEVNVLETNARFTTRQTQPSMPPGSVNE